MREVETVDEHCKHKDCKYRGHMTGLGFGVHWCMYLYITERPRNCDISNCDKYEAGKVKVWNSPDGLRYMKDDV